MSEGSRALTGTADVVIIGAGIVGLTTARALAKRGLRDVVLIEKSTPGREASWAAGGILAPQIEADRPDDFFRLACASRDLYPSFAEALKDETGIDPHLDQTGTLYLSFTEADECELRRRIEWQTSEGLTVEWLGKSDARELEGNISPHIRGAARFPNEWQVENRRLVDALVSANEKLGVNLITHCKVNGFQIEKERIQAVQTAMGTVHTSTVVLAAGAWSSFVESTGTVPPRVEVEPVRGQMLCFQARPPVSRHVLYSSRGYLVPRRDERILAGSTTEHAGFNKQVTPEGIESITSLACELMPAIRDLSLIDSWAGLRPRAKDGLPVLGCSEETAGLFYATGHYRNGILLAPITGELIAREITDGAAEELLQPFSPKTARKIWSSPA
jgi:glycine oxidase